MSLEQSRVWLTQQIDGLSSSSKYTVAWSSVTGKVIVFGDNSNGTLGLEDCEEQTEPTEIESFSEAATYGIKISHASAGDTHCLAMMNSEDSESDQIVFGWGSNDFNQLGCVETRSGVGSDSRRETMEEDSSFIPMPYQVLKTMQERLGAVYCYSSYSAAISSQGILYTWGRGDCGRLGYNPPLKVQKIPTKVDLPCKLVKVSLGLYHCLGLSTTGQVYSWGSGVSGQLGHDKILSEVTKYYLERAQTD